MTTERLNWVDISKGIGIILVVYGHVARGMDTAGISFLGFKEIDTFIYSFHMPLFFALSGYFFVQSTKRSTDSYLRSKISSILYPYLIWSLIQILIQYGMSHLINGNVVWNDVLTFYKPRGQYWFLFALLMINLINFMAYRLLSIYGIMFTTTLSFICLVLNPDLGVLNLGLNNLVFFNLGILFSMYSRAVGRIFLSANLLVTSVLILFIVEAGAIFYDFNFILLPVVTGLTGTLFIAQLSNQFLSNQKHLIELGRHSMPIYLMHTIFSGGIRIFLFKFMAIENTAIHIVLGMLGGIYIPLLLYKHLLAERFKLLFSLNLARPKA